MISLYYDCTISIGIRFNSDSNIVILISSISQPYYLRFLSYTCVLWLAYFAQRSRIQCAKKEGYVFTLNKC